MACVGLGREGGGLLGLGFVFMVWRAWLWAGGHVGWVANAKLRYVFLNLVKFSYNLLLFIHLYFVAALWFFFFIGVWHFLLKHIMPLEDILIFSKIMNYSQLKT